MKYLNLVTVVVLLALVLESALIAFLVYQLTDVNLSFILVPVLFIVQFQLLRRFAIRRDERVRSKLGMCHCGRAHADSLEFVGEFEGAIVFECECGQMKRLEPGLGIQIGRFVDIDPDDKI